MYLVDTNVISELRKRDGIREEAVAAGVNARPRSEMYTSVMCLGEIGLGVMRRERRDPAAGRVLREWLERAVIPAFDGRVLPIDSDIQRRAATLMVPDARPWPVAMIAATALTHGLAVVMRNTQDFAGSGVRVSDPWVASGQAG
ncbi:type II toxin-antitoxin system VapC family toxin [Demequina sp. NBRC 110051]|uniref:type II toxin-antitoxin system VapC family toxin n=1 Tax=Demequina sp. NBRC 110051 TaxID=1570340 RepID=UPI000A060F2C|nr:type II toxin-antitoxin system VapC family toxin [Demequina sp. NBRC 110051]